MKFPFTFLVQSQQVLVDEKSSKLIDEVVYGSSFYDVFISLLD